MSLQWFWRTKGELYGPLSTEELASLIERNRIADDDQIRLPDTEEWLTAAEVKAALADSNVGPSSETPSQAAARLLSDAPRRRLRRGVEQPSRAVVLTGLISAAGRRLKAITENWRDLIAAAVACVPRLIGAKTTLAVVAVVLLAVLLAKTDFGDTPHESVFAQLATTWDELHSLRNRGASNAQWQQFEQQTLAWLQPMIEDLEASAHTRPVRRSYWSTSSTDAAIIRRELLFSARNLQALLAKAGRSDARREQDFVESMAAANDYLTGERSIGKTLAFVRQQRAARSAILAALGDPLIAGIVVLDAAVIGGAGFLWWRRRRRAHRQSGG